MEVPGAADVWRPGGLARADVRHQADESRRVGRGLRPAALAGSLQRPEHSRRAPLGPQWPPRRRARRPARRRSPAAPPRGGRPRPRAPLPRAGHALTHAARTRVPPGAAPGRTPTQSGRPTNALPPGGGPACLPPPGFALLPPGSALRHCRCEKLHAPAPARALRRPAAASARERARGAGQGRGQGRGRGGSLIGHAPAARVPSRTAPAGSRAASCSATAPMPAAGRQLAPVARQRMTNSNSRELVPRSASKKMPPRKGRKKRSMMASEKPSACGASRAQPWRRAPDRATLPIYLDLTLILPRPYHWRGRRRSAAPGTQPLAELLLRVWLPAGRPYPSGPAGRAPRRTSAVSAHPQPRERGGLRCS